MVSRLPDQRVPILKAGITEFAPVEYVSELVQGRRLVNPNSNIDMVIAYSSDAKKILGITYEAFEHSERLRHKADAERDHVIKDLAISKQKLDILYQNKKDSDYLYYLRYGSFPNDIQ